MEATATLTSAQLRAAAFAAILKDLGPVGLARFVAENNLGEGDYTRDRQQWLPADAGVDDLVAEWRAGVGNGPDSLGKV